MVGELAFHTHGLGNEVHAARGDPRVVAETDEGIETNIELVDGDRSVGKPVALGFAALVDAVHFRSVGRPRARFAALSSEAQRALRTSWFEETVVDDAVLCRARRTSRSGGSRSSISQASRASRSAESKPSPLDA